MPRAAFKGHSLTTPWDPLHRAYFNGYALWTYLTTPFLLADPEIQVAASLQFRRATIRGAACGRRSRTVLPLTAASRTSTSRPTGLLRRHDYHVDVAGGFPAAQLVSGFVETHGLRFPTDGVPTSAAPTCARSPTP